MEGAIKPGVLHKYKIPLRDADSCKMSFNGDLPDSLICAGGMEKKMGNFMMEGGLLSFLKKKMMMMKVIEMMKRGERPGEDDLEEIKEEVMEKMTSLNLQELLSYLQKVVDKKDGVEERHGKRRGGAWSLYEMMREGMEEMGGMEDMEGMDRMGEMMQEMGMGDMVEEMGMGDMMGGEQDETGDEENQDDMMMENEAMGEMERMMMEEGMDKEEIMETMMQGQCMGDKGGPLVASVNGQWYVLGVTSLPYGCLYKGSPGLYSHVFGLGDWIKPIYNNYKPKSVSKQCQMGEFSCGDGWCVPEDQRCDGKKDCTLGTDEHFCDGALKGFNVYFDQAIKYETWYHNHSVYSPQECALSCLKAPFLCSGFDVYIPYRSFLMNNSMMDSMMEAEGMMMEEEEDDNDNDHGMKKTKMLCVLADKGVEVHHVDVSLSDVAKALVKGKSEDGEMPRIHFHFKLPQHAPITALLSPKYNLHLPKGLVVSPSYVLGHRIGQHIDDHKLQLMFLKVALVEQLVELAYKKCLVSHADWDMIEHYKMAFEKLGEKAEHLQMVKKMMMGAMEDMMGEGDDMEMEDMMDEAMLMEKKMALKANITWVKEHLYELKMNHSKVLYGIMMSCNHSEIAKGVLHKVKEVLSNFSCKADMGDGNMEATPMPGMEDMMDDDDMSNAFEELVKELSLANMYMVDYMDYEGDMGEDMDGGMDMGMSMGMDMDMGMGGVMMGAGSMMGDVWGMMGNDDPISMMMTNMVGMDMDDEMMGEEGMMKNLTEKKHKVLLKIKMIGAILMMGKCNMSEYFEKMMMMMMGGNMTMGWNMTMGGDMMGGDMMGGVMMGGDMMGGDMMSEDMMMAMMKKNMTKKQHMMLFALMMLKKLSNGHHKWTIMQSPLTTNKLHFRVLDSRGPFSCNNIHSKFGLMVARGGYLPPLEMLLGKIMKKMKMMKDYQGEMDKEEMGEKLEEYILSMLPPGILDILHKLKSMKGMEESEPGMMGEGMTGGMAGDEEMEESYMETDNEMMMMSEMMMGEGMMGEMMGEMMERMMGGEMGMMMEAMMEEGGMMEGDDEMEDDQGMGEEITMEMKAYLMAKLKKVVMKLKSKEGRGVAHCLSELHKESVVAVEGSHALIDQYSTKAQYLGVVMEYGSGYSCDETITSGPGHISSPMFPMNYPSNVACNHYLVAPPGHNVAVYMLRFRTQWQSQCMHDSLTIYDKTEDGWEKLGDKSFCGTMIPHVFRSSGQHLHLKFESDYATEDLGFKAFYTFIPAYASTMTEDMMMMPEEPDPTEGPDGGDDRLDTEVLERIDAAQEEAETFKIALIAVSCALGALLIITMVLMSKHYNDKIKALTAEEKTKL
ncbi:uncharacterized protein [Diadema antillarum]|uniref:uncharacterized protein n=1 Tax=Diadema antillarum TaxID=105358 RepID=UPI003A85B8EB